MHPDDDDTINCGDCRDTGRIVYARTDVESVDEDCCPYCQAGKVRAARRHSADLAFANRYHPLAMGGDP